MPQIGELSPGVWLASGFGGHGLNTTAMAGNIVAQAIAEGEDTWRLFAPFELVWAGGKLGRAAMQVYYWWFDARERFAARQARQREEEYRRGTELAALRSGEEQAHVEARLGAVVPRSELPEEPALAELPADPRRRRRDRLAGDGARRRRHRTCRCPWLRAAGRAGASVLDNDEQQDWAARRRSWSQTPLACRSGRVLHETQHPKDARCWISQGSTQPTALVRAPRVHSWPTQSGNGG